MRRYASAATAAMLVSMSAGAASAAVVTNPVPAPIAPGLTVGIEHFLDIPNSSSALPQARIQYVTPVRDGSGRMFVNDTRGQLWGTDVNGTAPTLFLDLNTAGVNMVRPNEGETGLLGVAFHPNFGGDANAAGYGTFYTGYTASSASGVATYLDNDSASHEDVLREWVVADPNAATATIASTREVLRVGQFAYNHNIGTIGFNPTAGVGDEDYGQLYIGFGDGGGANDPRNNGQNLASPLGKILRIDPLDPDGPGGLNYAISDDNPDLGSGSLGEIWAYGLRHPQHFSWDSETGAMYIMDIGQAQLEEVNLGIAGANYGWDLREGTFAKSGNPNDNNVYDLPENDADFGFTYPIAQYDHDEGSAISAGFVYRGDAIPELEGMFLLSDIVNGRIFYFDPEGATPGSPRELKELLLTLDGDAFSFLGAEGYGAGRVDLRMGVDEFDEIYFLTKRNGDIYRFERVEQVVPEPASWAMMIAGFGLVGGAMRGRRRVAMAV